MYAEGKRRGPGRARLLGIAGTSIGPTRRSIVLNVGKETRPKKVYGQIAHLGTIGLITVHSSSLPNLVISTIELELSSKVLCFICPACIYRAVCKMGPVET